MEVILVVLYHKYLTHHILPYNQEVVEDLVLILEPDRMD